MSKKYFFVFAAFLLIATSGCDPQVNCYSEYRDFAVASFNINNSDSSSLGLRRVYVEGYQDSIIVSDDTVSKVILPLNPTVNITRYVFETTDNNIYTLEMEYKTTSRLISPECGPEVLFRELTATDYTYDTVAVFNRTTLRRTTNDISTAPADIRLFVSSN
ncbi:DUF6452 family protein [Mangrovivirga cuniculi]|uniref:Uncharacterized protein n=1 Tax=Mangrovivirga cuniculi TaxID=2715131 RepID=A0A4D7JAW7_9BACT|nr:DUF6452 family protein [Mangrovivirga cuniculi]QCK13549.1 hypothetical protein DCC35_01660 [Mangrovivirga cuniculi]